MDNNSQQREVQYYPLTHPQKRVWYLEKTYPNQSLHNIGGTVRIKEAVHFDHLENAIHGFIQQHEGVRLRFTESQGDVSQYVQTYEPQRLRFYDFSRRDHPEEEFKRWVDQEAAKPFSLYHHSLFEWVLFKLGENEGGYLIKMHHLISDGWTMNLLTQQICTAYRKLVAGESLDFEPQGSYLSYIPQEQTYRSSQRFLKDKQFWKDKFSTLPASIQQARFVCGEGQRKTFVLPKGLSSRVKEWTSVNQTTPYPFFVLLYLLYQYHRTGHDDIVLGMPLLNRSGKEKRLVGMFTSTMPFRYRLQPESTATQMLAQIGSELKRCYYHQRYPFDLLVKDLELNKKGYHHLLDTAINFYNTDLTRDIAGSSIENTEFHNGKQLYSLQLVIREWSNTEDFHLDFDYKVEEYTGEQIEQMFLGMVHLMEQILDHPEESIRNFTVLSEEEKRKLLIDFNATDRRDPQEKNMVQLFEDQVCKTPDKVAVRFEAASLSYSELNRRANQLARALQQKGVQIGDIVGISTHHSMETILGILAVLKVRGSYLPIDPDYPLERKEHMLRDSGSRILLINKGGRDSIPLVENVVDLDTPGLYGGEDTNLAIPYQSTDVAYMIYTSGSTGLPKGTMIEQSGLVNYCTWAVDQYIGSSQAEVFPFYSSLSFDLTVTSIFPPLISGNEIIIYPPDDQEYVLYKIVREQKATIVKVTPSHLSLLREGEHTATSIKTWIVGGEDLKVDLAKAIQDRFGEDVRIFNEYGPTEATVGCMIHQYDRKKDQGASVPIGTPAYNTQIYVLDERQHPVPSGEVGEIYISGVGVAKGYRNRREESNDRFILNPFMKGWRMYKTGDLARFVDRNHLVYMGRSDSQVKIRGYRIELGEIEQALVSHPCIVDAVVVSRASATGTHSLYAYYVAKYSVTPLLLQNFLHGLLPDYMIPLFFVSLESIPLTINGKVDQERLPAPKVEQENTKRSDTEGAAQSDQTTTLLSIIQQVLNRSQISVMDNFYHVGGDSIKAIQIQSKLNQMGYTMRVQDILSHPVINDMVYYLNAREQEDSSPSYPCVGQAPILPAAAWFFAQNFQESHHYTQSVLLNVGEAYDYDCLQIALHLLVHHHDTLRFNYDSELKQFFYNPLHLRNSVSLDRVDLSHLSSNEQLERLTQVGEGIKASFQLHKDLLFKACLFHLGNQGHRLLLTAHHLVVDGISWRILLEDFFTLYEQLRRQEQVTLPEKTDTVKRWGEVLTEFSQGDALRSKAYWQSIRHNDNRDWMDFDHGEDRIEDCEVLTHQLTVTETERLIREAPGAYRTKVDDLMIMALALTLKDLQSSNEVIIEVEGHGREEIDATSNVSRTVGWFTSFYPVHLAPEGKTLDIQIKGLKEQLRGIPDSGLSYGVLTYMTNQLPSPLHKCVRFNYLGDFSTSFLHQEFSFAEEDSGRESSSSNTFPCLIDIVAYVMHQKLYLSFTYSRKKFLHNTVVAFKELYLQHLQKLIDHCCAKEQPDFTPSDFETTTLSSEELDSIFD
ncbi:non-ribosomal peptide synthetase [Marininema halotolerans]|uniref:Non-ribosomal peptide synthase domain TIGR01720/amino acid adenylation domain-containing protein n=1 Tax=Marininema halotolerans TaxID=1155944 RepID=A0A1I6Q2L2_9BACL|nr:non-ribosomal peptide synthetase [Marininema halotolerans]SFS46652.1 non-ribosomal peptide synthase domain TIGR01720/amino acid adenylation domain-containing protein [Marininema halotolerans]